MSTGGNLTFVRGDRYAEALDPVSAAILDVAGGGTSIFDPVLCEIAYRWFCPPGGTVLDPFAGGSVRGIVASRLGSGYLGIELRAEQVAANEAQLDLAGDPAPRWACGDSCDLARLAGDCLADLVFSCPPYWNLERYSDDLADLSTMGVEAFFKAYTAIIAAEAVYASPAEGGAQTALAHTARAMGKRATIFVAQRARPHPRTLEAARLGAKVVPVAPGYLSVVQSWARDYCRNTGAALIPFGAEMPGSIEAIAAAARATGLQPDEVWCAAGSGVLARGLALAWPKARRHVVQVGRDLKPKDMAGAHVHVHPLAFGRTAKAAPPFPSDPHYDAKAWELCVGLRGPGQVLFWNVAPLPRP